MVRQVQPLRISKSGNTPSSTPNKMAATRNALADITSASPRRNSPSYNQATRKMIVSRDSSPYTENSFTNENSSPRDFWKTRDPMSPSRFDSEANSDREQSPGLLSPKRRASIEKLKQAGRVKQSNIFALETKDAYDPSSLPIVERPSANRPLSGNLVNNSFTRFDSIKKENNPLQSPKRPNGHKRTESETAVPFITSPYAKPISSPQKEPASSPTKSSLSRTSQFGGSFEHDNTPWSDGDDRAPTPRALHRHNKSVTFHEADPEINVYENPTPEPSVSAASGSREGSFDSDDYYDECSFERGSSLEPYRNDDSFDADLENADKTPVVLPEDWSRMSPDEARRDLVDDGDDVFEGSSPSPQRPHLSRSESVTSDGESRPLPPLPAFMNDRRNSAAAAAERASNLARNLPSPPKRASCSKEAMLNYTGQSDLKLRERLELLSHGEVTERPGSKHSEGHAELTITNLDTGEKMGVQVKEEEVEEVSQLADLADFEDAPPKISRESILRKIRNSKYEFEDDEDTPTEGGDSPTRPSYEELALMDPDEPIPSRETSHDASEHYLGAHLHDREQSADVEIKDEPLDEEAIDLSAIPAIDESLLEAPRSPSRIEDYERQSSVLRHDVSGDLDDSESQYSSVEPDAESTVLHAGPEQELDTDEGKEKLEDAMQLLTVKDFSQAEPSTKQSVSGDFMGLPSYLASDDFDFGMKDYMAASPAPEVSTKKNDIIASAPKLQPAPSLESPMEVKPAVKDLPRPTYDGAEYDDPDLSPPGTPDSVIHHSSSEVHSFDELPAPAAVEPEVPVIPERRATIKTNGQLRARPSATPADLRAMAEQRRIVSAGHPVPPIPQAYQAETETTQTSDVDEEPSQYSSDGNESKADSAVEPSQETTRRSESRKQLKLDLDIPHVTADDADDGLGLEHEFERVIESQKVPQLFPSNYSANFGRAYQHGRAAESFSHAPTTLFSTHQTSAGANRFPRKQKGYLMRQNTKVVVATNRNFSGDSNGTSNSNDMPMSPSAEARPSSRGGRSANSSPRKGSGILETEAWNGKSRRKSQRQASAAQYSSGPAPPLPGQASALGVVNEDFAAGTSSLEDDVGEGVERGRLFVKVAGVKDLDLPMPKNDRLYFQLTLDNGLHCVTTTSLELGKNAPIGQEFELVVLNDLEFQLTLNTKLPPPPKQHIPLNAPASPSKNSKHQKTSSLSRFLTSPKKRAEKERQEREAVEADERRQVEEERRKRASVLPTAWDLLHDLVNAQDGSFARAYVNLKAHEKQCFGRKLIVDVPCYNEWALERDSHVVNSVRSKRGNAGPVRRPPYVVGHLQLELLYVPKPAGASDEDMPKSMSSAVREMNRASERVEVVHEGYLSQQGGDCVHWRRRFFRLQGPRLTAYHEHTQQKRAVINLTKATRLVDDKSTLVADPKSGNPGSKGGRRKSAFAEEDEGYAYVEEGFRIRFANGETIDFYADKTADKEEWMTVLSQVIGKADPGKKAASWTDLVSAREKIEGIAAAPQGLSTTEVRDFTKPPAPARKLSDRKPVSKSVPASPVKAAAPSRQVPMPPVAESGSRPKTPPMSPRRGHRSRDAVKSMIF
ncbi:putative pleckstrin domain, PH-like domain superfamily [Septoria linicola]|nr:putative pleckstrin domain, PH-like domain superfamily [Septoria linicola]